jgi:hypothetical protein
MFFQVVDCDIVDVHNIVQHFIRVHLSLVPSVDDDVVVGGGGAVATTATVPTGSFISQRPPSWFYC